VSGVVVCGEVEQKVRRRQGQGGRGRCPVQSARSAPSRDLHVEPQENSHQVIVEMPPSVTDILEALGPQ
jgi:hypothetical protein